MRTEPTAFIAGPPESVFAFIDDHSRLSSHMSQSSWMMGGGSMRTELDHQKGQAVGSHIRLIGSAFGPRIFLDEVVTRRDPPTRKEWEPSGPVARWLGVCFAGLYARWCVTQMLKDVTDRFAARESDAALVR